MAGSQDANGDWAEQIARLLVGKSHDAIAEALRHAEATGYTFGCESTAKAALIPSAPIAAPVRETIERAWKDGAYWAQAEAGNADAWLMVGASAERYALGVIAEDAVPVRVDGAWTPVVEDDITQAMIQAGRHAANLNDGTLADIYLAMANAAPAGDVPKTP